LLGETVIVENRPGQGGSIVLGSLAQSAPDGHTLVLAPLASLVVNPHLYKSIGYDSKRDFATVALVADLPLLLVVTPSLPVKTVPELIAYAKANPDKLANPSSGNGTLSHLGMEVFKQDAGLSILHVPYRGGTGLVNALLTGEVDAGWSGISNVLALINTGKLRALCLSVLQRDVSLPDVPTCDELGYKGFDIATMLGLQSSAGVPPAIVARLQSAVAKILREPEMAERMKTLGIHMAENGTAAYAKFMQDDLDRYTKIVNEFHLQIK